MEIRKSFVVFAEDFNLRRQVKMRYFLRSLLKGNFVYVGYVIRRKSFPVLNWRYPHLDSLDIHVVDHCNLNCKGCCTLSPVAGEWFCEISEVKKDLFELSRKVRISQIGLIGGEPLLHPKLIDLIQIVREAYPKGSIVITTNGSLLPKMPALFWRTCKENKVLLNLSLYPPFLEKLWMFSKLAKSNNVAIVPVENFSVWKDTRRSFTQNGYCSGVIHRACEWKKCHKLWHSKLYLCVGCFFQHYNRYFNETHETIKGYDIYKYSGKELVQFMKRPDPACRYCTWVMKNETMQWDYSKREKSEWCNDV